MQVGRSFSSSSRRVARPLLLGSWKVAGWMYSSGIVSPSSEQFLWKLPSRFWVTEVNSPWMKAIRRWPLPYTYRTSSAMPPTLSDSTALWLSNT